jgi:excisionase family DNA binding protein
MSLTAAEVRAIVREEIADAPLRRGEHLPDVLTRAQVAELLHVEDHTITRWVKAKGLPGVKLEGGGWRFVRAEVMQWLTRQGR